MTIPVEAVCIDLMHERDRLRDEVENQRHEVERLLARNRVLEERLAEIRRVAK